MKPFPKKYRTLCFPFPYRRLLPIKIYPYLQKSKKLLSLNSIRTWRAFWLFIFICYWLFFDSPRSSMYDSMYLLYSSIFSQSSVFIKISTKRPSHGLLSLLGRLDSGLIQDNILTTKESFHFDAELGSPIFQFLHILSLVFPSGGQKFIGACYFRHIAAIDRSHDLRKGLHLRR